MTRFRRVRWIAITAVAATVAGALLVNAEGWADRGAASCSATANVRVDGTSWRTGAFRAAGCRAWRHMHRRSTTPGYQVSRPIAR